VPQGARTYHLVLSRTRPAGAWVKEPHHFCSLAAMMEQHGSMLIQCSHIDMRAVFEYALNEYIHRRRVMPRVAVDDNKRMNLRVRPEQKATLVRAAALRHTDLTDFVLQPALREAKKVIEEAERIMLSERDSLMVLKLLEKPPAPNARLRKALASLPKAK